MVRFGKAQDYCRAVYSVCNLYLSVEDNLNVGRNVSIAST